MPDGQTAERVEPTTDIRRWVIPGVRALVAVVVLWWVVSRAEIGETVRAIAGAGFWALIGAFVASVALTVVVSLRLAYLLRRGGMDLPWVRVWMVNLAAQFYGLFVPGGAVTTTAIRYVKLAGGEVTGRRLVYRMLADRAGGLAGLAFVGALAWAAGVGSVFAAVLAVAAGTAAVVLPRLLPDAWGDDPDRAIPSGWRSALGSSRDLPWLFAVSVVAQVPGIVAFVLIAASLDIEMAVVTIVWIRSAALLAGALPFSIAGLGIREGVLLVALTERGVAEADAVAFGLLVFGMTIVGPAIIGALAEFREFVSRGWADRASD